MLKNLLQEDLWWLDLLRGKLERGDSWHHDTLVMEPIFLQQTKKPHCAKNIFWMIELGTGIDLLNLTTWSHCFYTYRTINYKPGNSKTSNLSISNHIIFFLSSGYRFFIKASRAQLWKKVITDHNKFIKFLLKFSLL